MKRGTMYAQTVHFSEAVGAFAVVWRHGSMRVYYAKSQYCDKLVLPTVNHSSYQMGLEMIQPRLFYS
jgi:hypothetical protein